MSDTENGAESSVGVGQCDDCGRSIAPVSEKCADCLEGDRGATLADFGGGDGAE